VFVIVFWSVYSTGVEKVGIGGKTLKLFYNVVGTISLVCGVVGVVLPVVPTTPFVVLSAACYCKGSERLHGWLTRNRVFGPILRDYEGLGGMRRATKVRALTMMWVAVLGSAVLFLDTFVMRALAVSLAVVGSVCMLRVKTLD
jgi:uncharacterized membrane protein YbaN (DUF454 family)